MVRNSTVRSCVFIRCRMLNCVSTKHTKDLALHENKVRATLRLQSEQSENLGTKANIA